MWESLEQDAKYKYLEPGLLAFKVLKDFYSIGTIQDTRHQVSALILNDPMQCLPHKN